MLSGLENKYGGRMWSVRIIRVIRWISGLFFLLIVPFALKDNFVFGLGMLVVGLLLLPKVDEFLKNKWGVVLPTWAKWMIGVLAFGVGASFIPKTELKKEGVAEEGFVASSSAKIPEESKNEEFFWVKRVVDGDTIELDNGETVRYIGMDAPEVKDGGEIECYANESKERNKELVEGKRVKMEKDVSDKDKYDRLLRYVYVDGKMVNELLVREGFASVATYSPDVKNKNILIEAERLAREEAAGLWSDRCVVKEVVIKKIPTITQEKTKAVLPAATSAVGGWGCDCKKTCAQMSCEEAQYQLNTCGCKARDGNKDGMACDNNCR